MGCTEVYRASFVVPVSVLNLTGECKNYMAFNEPRMEGAVTKTT